MGAGRRGRSEGGDVEADLISRLRQLPAGPQPDPRFKAELRTQLISIAPRVIAEGRSEAKKSPYPPASRRSWARLRSPLLAVAGGAAVLVLLLGLAVHLAGSALPGQSLYGLKRASEDFRLSVSGGSAADKGARYLSLASSRAAESSRLLGSSAAADPDQESLIASTLRTADAETRSGLQLLGSAAVSAGSVTPLAAVPDWVSTQRNAIQSLLPSLPAGPGLSQARQSLALLQRVTARVSQWDADLTKGCLSQARSDDLGPLGC
ncbi:MAG TPA: hypothetical protein VHO01_05965 [Jatrophihabitans sp.]|nr:hypothetical protein [Jatrophihabitans sp.]